MRRLLTLLYPYCISISATFYVVRDFDKRISNRRRLKNGKENLLGRHDIQSS